jgi:[protein-PII] uridylyltransferase
MSLDDLEPLSTYLRSMPLEYRSAFDDEAVRAHEAIVRRRGERTAHVEVWRELSERVVAICVVADDRPGLLSCISAALVESHIDVVSARAYCRTREDGSIEAVDVLWIRRLPGSTGLAAPIRARDVAAIADAIARAVTAAGVSPALPSSTAQGRTTRPIRARESAPPVATGASARVRFETNAKDGSTILTVEAVDRPGLLLAVTQALFRAGVQIVGLRATTERGSAVDRFTLAEVDGKPLRPARLLSLQTAILGAIDESALAPQRRSVG